MLCGSRRYPVKEPFVELLKGSLKTFLNAMTAPDKTMYPVASQNKQDFFNLVSVYLDACLNPRILDPVQGPQTLKQEGWHYMLDDVDAPLKFSGVVVCREGPEPWSFALLRPAQRPAFESL